MPAPDPARILRQHLQTDALLGAATVPTPTPITHTRTPNPKPKPGHSAAPPRVAPSRPTPQTQTRQTNPSNFALKQPPARDTAPPLPPTHPADIKLIAGLSTADKIKRLDALKAEFEQDPKVQALRLPGTNLVFGQGDPDAKILFIGEGPGEQEDRTGQPFVGPASELLDKMITAMGLSRETVYIANLVKYRPPSNRTPSPEEIAAQGPTLAHQIAIINPTVLVALGGAAAKYALNTTTSITRLRGQWAPFAHTDPALPVMPTFHPAYLLRSYTPDNRKKVWADLQAVLAKRDA